MEADVSVSPELDELLLGCDWLTEQGGSWDFKSGTVHLKGREVRLRSKHSDYGCRRVSATESCVIPPHHEMNVPVKLEGLQVHQPSIEWALETRAVRDGVLVARTLFGNENNVKIARILNHTGSPYQLSQGDLVGAAEPVTVYNPPKASPDSRGKEHAPDKNGEWKMPFPNISHQRREAMRVKAKDKLEHVQCLIDGLPKDLTPREHQMAVTFIRLRANSFSRADFDIGRTDIIKHRIDTGSNHPHYERLRRHPTSQLAVIDEQVEDMLRHDIIEPAASPWCSNVVMVRKKDGAMRFCIDYRKVNELIVRDKFPLPKINTFFDMLNGSHYFSSCDLRQGYWQTVISEEDRDKTAFVTRKGQWRFKVQSFGLCNARSQFARTMELILAGLTYEICLIYLRPWAEAVFRLGSFDISCNQFPYI